MKNDISWKRKTQVLRRPFVGTISLHQHAKKNYFVMDTGGELRGGNMCYEYKML